MENIVEIIENSVEDLQSKISEINPFEDFVQKSYVLNEIAKAKAELLKKVKSL